MYRAASPGCLDPFLFAIEVRALIVGPVVVRFFLVTAAVGLCLVGTYPVFRGQLFQPAQSRKDDTGTSKTLPT